ncbi:uncharacterized protein LOC113225853 [Hyposmocoma kahamanoa]|uniref:uncharacterized protein LOC113225853 n=1 Tax=Hyposmocoma kahamanoa TaxID=1477025 RepID=UPI000E6D8A9B|nr:uncharacterized protein LOC113225853 [Hyposmocoma kahamanoa]
MTRTVVVPVVKNKTGDICDKCNYRSVSLVTIIAKVLDDFLNSQLDTYLNLYENQFGFRPGLSTESAILSLKRTVRYYEHRNTPVYWCFLDLSKAFDLACYDILRQKLNDICMPAELTDIVNYWYHNQINVVRWGGKFSEPYPLECGVSQIGLSSPKLFNLYINALIGELSGARLGCYIDGIYINNISYADDMLLLSASVCGLTKLISICERYAASHRLKYNITKSECMVFKVKHKCLPNIPPVLLNGSPLKRVDQFQYLGHLVTSDINDNANVE